jgi:rapamycin-insensitive companion of mTOR
LSHDTPLVRKRAALWTIGHIASSTNGFRLIQRADLLREIVNLAENAEILSLRGTSIYILGLICNTPEGRAEI